MANRVLLVEDDRPLREVTAHHLASAGYVVEAVGDGEAALEAYDPRRAGDVAALIRGVVGRTELTGDGHAITCEAAAVTVGADAARIEQAVANLVRNAVVHAGGGRAAASAVAAAAWGSRSCSRSPRATAAASGSFARRWAASAPS